MYWGGGGVGGEGGKYSSARTSKVCSCPLYHNRSSLVHSMCAIAQNGWQTCSILLQL